MHVHVPLALRRRVDADLVAALLSELAIDTHSAFWSLEQTLLLHTLVVDVRVVVDERVLAVFIPVCAHKKRA